MNTRLIFASCFFLLPLKACAQSHQNITAYMNENNNSVIVLRSDGLYNTYDSSRMACGERRNETYKTYSPLIIINNSNLIYSNGLGSLDNRFLKIESYYNRKPIFGEYSVIGDSIYVKNLPVGLMAWGGRIKMYFASFRGYLKNRDTIMDWKMVKPYPKANARLNDNFKFETTPKLLYFIESKELSSLDSLYQQRLREDSNKKN